MAVLRRKEYHVESNGIKGNQFQVKASSKMFETLMSTLYRHKEEATVRELACNANDAHKERNRRQRPLVSGYGQSVYENAFRGAQRPDNKWFAPPEKTWDLHVPSSINPYLEIADYGVGLAVHQIMGYEWWVDSNGTEFQMNDEWFENGGQVIDGKPVDSEYLLDDDGKVQRSGGMYTTLFDSTKETDNDQTGAFGLGSKSPFSIADSFTVESRVNGEKHMYVMYMDANRMPMVDWITKDDKGFPAPLATDEFNGVTVKVTIQTDSFYAVRNACEKVIKVFETKPRIDGYPITVEDIDRDRIIGQTFMQSNTSIHYAVTGDVAYPIEVDKLDPDIRAVFKKMRRGSYTFFPIGELNVPPSREDLSYDEFTLEALNRRLTFAADNIGARIREDFDGCKHSMYETMNKYNELIEIWGSDLLKSIKFTSKTGQKFSLSKEMEIPVPREKLENGNERDIFTMHRHTITGDGRTRKDEYGTQAIKVDHIRNGIVLFLDTPRMYLKKALHIAKELEDNEDRGIHNVYMVTPRPDSKITAKEVSEAFGHEIEVYTSSMIKPPRATYGAAASSGLSKYGSGTSRSWQSWDKVTPTDLEEDILTSDKPWLYVNLNGFVPDISMERIRRDRNFFSELDVNPYAGVIGVRKAALKVVEENPDMFVQLDGARDAYVNDTLNALTPKERRYMQYWMAGEWYDRSTITNMATVCSMLMPERLVEFTIFTTRHNGTFPHWDDSRTKLGMLRTDLGVSSNPNVKASIHALRDSVHLAKKHTWIKRITNRFNQLDKDMAALHPDIFRNGSVAYTNMCLSDLMDKIHLKAFLKEHDYKRGESWVGVKLSDAPTKALRRMNAPAEDYMANLYEELGIKTQEELDNEADAADTVLVVPELLQ
ncbi:hypothetical protein MYOV003v1_p0092 [Vibrio phage 207E48.1]|nr:hypothetical protein MYOV003v1_p0092 [Vibrio phage 207E48.1]